MSAVSSYSSGTARPARRIGLSQARKTQTMTTLNARASQTGLHRVLDAIGNTPLVALRSVVPHGSARVVAKLESANPTGSMKDRMARALVERASSDNRLPPAARWWNTPRNHRHLARLRVRGTGFQDTFRVL